MAGLREQIIGRHWAPCPRRIKFTVGQWPVPPAFADAIENFPGRFDLIPSDEQRGIARNYVQQKALISFGRVSAELRVIAEVHADRPHLDARAGNFAIEAQVYSLFGLEPQSERVGIEFCAALRRKQNVRRGPKLDPHLARAQRQSLARPKIKWDAGPAPVI